MRHPAALLLCFLGAGPGLAETPSAAPWRELLLPRTELAGSANALTRWRPELPALFPPDTRIIGQLVHDSSPLADTPDDDEALQAWLAPLLPRLSVFTLHPGESFQAPALFGPETPFPDHQPLRQLAQVRLAALKTHWRAHRREEALALAVDNLALARALLSTQEGLVPLLHATGVWQLSLDGVYWLSRQPDLTPAQAAWLQLVLLQDEGLATDALVRAFRGEFTFFTHLVIERLPRTRDIDLLLSGIGSLGMAPPSPPAEGEPRLAIPVRDPFDREATLQSAADDIRGWITAFSTDARHPRGLGATHTGRRLKAYAEEIPELLRYATQDAAATPGQVVTVDAEVAGVENPVGKIFLIIATSQWEPLSAHVHRREAQRRALTGLLAWKRLGRPAAWKDLVTAGLLPAPPADPFAKTLLHFNLAKRRVWSVGENGIDDGGLGDGENTGRPPDLVWPSR